MTYVSGFLLAVPDANKDAYVKAASEAWKLFKGYGALSVAECWGTDVPDGKVTSFPMAVKLEPGETVVFSWIIWPDKAVAEACFAAGETDPRFNSMSMPFDGKRLIWGGFVPVYEAQA